MCMNFTLSWGDVIVISTVAIFTAPIWVVGGAGMLVVNGVSNIKNELTSNSSDAVATVQKSTDSPAKMQALQAFIDAVEKNPDALNLLRCGAAMLELNDIVGARGFVRRSVELGRAQGLDQARSPLFILALYTYGIVQLRWQLFNEALALFEETLRLLSANTAPTEADTAAAAAAKADTTKLGEGEERASGAVDVAGLLDKIAFCRITIALRDNDAASAEDNHSPEHLAVLAKCVADYERAIALRAAATASNKHPEGLADLDMQLRLLMARYYLLVQSNSGKTPAVLRASADFMARLKELREGFEKIATAPRTRWDNTKDSVKTRGVAESFAAQCCFMLDDGDAAQRHVNRAKSMHAFVMVEAIEWATGESEAEAKAAMDDAVADAFSRCARPWPQVPLEELEDAGVQLHQWTQRSFHRPSWCKRCNKWISLAENKTAWHCAACNYRAHDHCYQAIKDAATCPHALQYSVVRTDSHIHVFRPCTLHKPTFCASCDKYIWNPKGASRCESCSCVVHNDCVKNVKNSVEAKK